MCIRKGTGYLWRRRVGARIRKPVEARQRPGQVPQYNSHGRCPPVAQSGPCPSNRRQTSAAFPPVTAAKKTPYRVTRTTVISSGFSNEERGRKMQAAGIPPNIDPIIGL